eukprot:scpid29664/ scgid0256/ Disintegrin and metalloproteinase domain-containing protein 28; Epididymial metalloproteinase-like, disintegrin-like, and cysteine-rich protein II
MDAAVLKVLCMLVGSFVSLCSQQHSAWAAAEANQYGSSVHADGSTAGYGHEQLRQLASHYELVDILTAPSSGGAERVQRSAGSRRRADREAVFEFTAFDERIRLNMLRNDVLLAPGFHVRAYTGDDIIMSHHDAAHCHYQGTMSGHSAGEGHAVLSTCHGLSGMFSVGRAGHCKPNHTYIIEPFSGAGVATTPGSSGSSQMHAVFRLGDARTTDQLHACGIKAAAADGILDSAHAQYNASLPDADTDHMGGASSHPRARRSVLTETKYIEILLVADHQLYKRMGSSRDATVNRALSILNLVDLLYRPLNIRVPVVSVEVWEESNKVSFSSREATTILNTFITYHASILEDVHHDVAYLISGEDFFGLTLGTAVQSAMCRGAASAGVGQDMHAAWVAAETVAHELGHGMAMQHDTAACTCAAGKWDHCVMAPAGSFSRQSSSWSDCSRQRLDLFFKSGSGHCLLNSPTQLYSSPSCGDGYLDIGEECDCGEVQDCADKCCNASTCRLQSTAQCSSGPCCEHCRFKAAHHLCREATGGCDVADYCSGTTHDCPSDLFVQTGQPCTHASGSSSICHNGVCVGTHFSQCKALWGSSAISASQECYTFNSQGTMAANCGLTSGLYNACASSDVKCGKLQCFYGSSKPQLDLDGQSAAATYTKLSFFLKCKSASVSGFSGGANDPTYVSDYTTCATDSVCVNRHCRTLSELKVPPCPDGNNGLVCSGNGACTHLNSCLCDIGYAGHACDIETQRPVLGEWGPWSSWSACSESCGTNGTRSRRRACEYPSPSPDGTPCSGADLERAQCNSAVACPKRVDGAWSQWSAWSSC